MYTFEDVSWMLGRRENTITKLIYQNDTLLKKGTKFDGYRVRITQEGFEMLKEILGTKDNRKRLK